MRIHTTEQSFKSVLDGKPANTGIYEASLCGSPIGGGCGDGGGKVGDFASKRTLRIEGFIRRGVLIAALLGGTLVLASVARAASFDCGKAVNDVDKLICENEEISKKDERLSTAYKKALAGAPDPALFKKEQQTWLKIRNEACYILDGHGEWTAISETPDESCLIDLYRDRVETLEYEASRSKNERKKTWASEAPLSMAAPVGERFEIHPIHESDRNLGHGYAICEAMVRWSNKNPDEMTCPAEVARTLPGIEDVEWQQLDPKAHEELIYKFHLLAALDSLAIRGHFNSWDAYIEGAQSNKWPDRAFQQTLRGKVKADIATGLKMWVFRGKLPINWETKMSDVTIIRLTRSDAHCLWDASKPTTESIAFVTVDLKELDPKVNSHTSHITGGRLLKRFKGQTFLIDASSDAMLLVERSYGISICEVSSNPTYWRNK